MKTDRIITLLGIIALSTFPFFTTAQNLDSLLIGLGRRDQQVRIETSSMLTSKNLDTLLMAVNRMEETDAECRSILYPMLDTLGWPKGLSKEADHAIWLILQHDSENQEKYLPQIEQAARQGSVEKDEYALFEDRLNMNASRPQRYGSQTILININDSESTEIYLWPVADPERLDSLRRTVGLQPIEKYLQLFEESYGRKAIWDPTITVKQMERLRRKTNTVRMKTNLSAE